MYDIIFISYEEPNAEQNWQILKDRFPHAKRVHGVKGIHNAHVKAAQKSFTKFFWVVDGDAEVKPDFDFSYTVPEHDSNTVHVWRSENPVNDLVYGYGGVKLLPTRLTKNMNTETFDMTTSISQDFKVIEEVSNITAFNTDSFSAWRSGFRECAKLASAQIDRQDDLETLERLAIWCNVGTNSKYGLETINGAKQGKKFGQKNKENTQELAKINDIDWLREMFNTGS